MQGRAAPLVLGVRQGAPLQQETHTVDVAAQDSQHERAPEVHTGERLCYRGTEYAEEAFGANAHDDSDQSLFE